MGKEMRMNENFGSVKVTMNRVVEGTPRSFDVSYTTAIEMLLIVGMGKWEANAPLPGQWAMFKCNQFAHPIASLPYIGL
jgi:hypothetical protein